jgi:GH24 family phage-related lysozyme (muramidase)
MTTRYLLADIMSDEGCTLVAIPDPLSPLAEALRARRPTAGLSGAPWTIGYGHTGLEVHPALAWVQSQADSVLASDVGKVCQGLGGPLPWWRDLNDARRDVLVNMGFNLGLHGLLEFKNALALIRGGQFQRAALAMLDSDWARQLVNRSHRLAMQMETGVRATP